jgi:hypothetical protein
MKFSPQYYLSKDGSQMNYNPVPSESIETSDILISGAFYFSAIS